MTPDEARELMDRYRVEVDDIDLLILDLFNQRAKVVEKIGAVKREAQLPIYEPKREDEVFRNVRDGNRGPLSHNAVKRLFERIIDEMRTVQRLRMEQEGN